MVEKETNSLFMTVLVKVINPVSIEERRSALDAMKDVPFV